MVRWQRLPTPENFVYFLEILKHTIKNFEIAHKYALKTSPERPEIRQKDLEILGGYVEELYNVIYELREVWGDAWVNGLLEQFIGRE